MVVNLFFYSAKDLVNLPMVFFVVAADFANERHQYSEPTTDKSHHDLNSHRIMRLCWCDFRRIARFLFVFVLLVLLGAPCHQFVFQS
jgi:hypothetical protein